MYYRDYKYYRYYGFYVYFDKAILGVGFDRKVAAWGRQRSSRALNTLQKFPPTAEATWRPSLAYPFETIIINSWQSIHQVMSARNTNIFLLCSGTMVSSAMHLFVHCWRNNIYVVSPVKVRQNWPHSPFESKQLNLHCCILVHVLCCSKNEKIEVKFCLLTENPSFFWVVQWSIKKASRSQWPLNFSLFCYNPLSFSAP